MFSKIYFKLSFFILLLIVIVQCTFMHFSVKSELQKLIEFKNIENSKYLENRIYTESFILNEIKEYKDRALIKLIMMNIFVIVCFIFIYHFFVGKYLNALIKMNHHLSPLETKNLIKNIPNDEIGDLVRSRIQMLDLVEENESNNKKLIRILIHDLNNSLALILGSVQFLQKHIEKLDREKILKKLSKIELGANTQKELIDTVRQIEAIESHKQIIKKENILFESLFNDAFTIFEEKLKKKDLSIKLISKEGFYIEVDKSLFLNNVLNNLISNSIKFSAHGNKITIETIQEENKKIIIFKDQGIGMSKELLNKIFDTQAKTSRDGTDGEKGTGFGMPLVKQTLNSFGAEVKVSSKTIEESQNDHGTEFRLIFT